MTSLFVFVLFEGVSGEQAAQVCVKVRSTR